MTTYTSKLNLAKPEDGNTSWGELIRSNFDTLDSALATANFAVSGWTAYTPTFTGFTLGNGSCNLKWRREGDCMRIRGSVLLGSTSSVTATTWPGWTFSLPSGYTTTGAWGLGTARQSTTDEVYSILWQASISAFSFEGVRNDGVSNSFTSSYPKAWSTGHNLVITDLLVPIDQWTSNINLSTDFQEFLSCDGTGAGEGVAANTDYTPTNPNRTSQGSLIPAVTITSGTATTCTRYILTPRVPLKPTDYFVIEVCTINASNSDWSPLHATGATSIGNSFSGSVPVGIAKAEVYGGNIYVSFSNAGRCSGGTYGSAGGSWAQVNTAPYYWRWRVRKVSNGNFAQQSAANVTKVLDNVAGSGSGQSLDSYPLSGSFTSYGGPLKINVSGAGWGSAAGLLTLNVKIDGTIVGTHNIYFNSGQGTLAITKSFYITGIAAGTHTLALTSPSIYMSAGNHFSAYVEEFTPAGSLSAYDANSALVNPETAITGTTTLTASNLGTQICCSGTTADYTVTLPPVASSTGKRITFRMANALTKLVTLKGNGSELIDGFNTRIMWAGEAATLYCDGASWSKIAGKSVNMIGAMQASATQTFASNTNTKLNTNVSASWANNTNMADTTNSRVVVKRPGVYRVDCSWRAQNLPSSGQLEVRWFKNGSEVSVNSRYATAGDWPVLELNEPAILAAGDYIEVYIKQYIGSLTAISAQSNNCSLTVQEVAPW